ncbi:hypothetical protein [Longivirga aurantiaca]|uniref:Type 4 fimbrial biogenesis protein PilX N-terminal domain-containing protein n=1 Tax=Longivirga aurantiaca TaxID=1837743 RepID=A0ABW1T2R4_9ACTN
MWTTRLRQIQQEPDSGLALVVVLLVMGLMTLLVVAITTLTIGSLRSSTDHDKFEGAVAAAETGVDRQLAELQKDQSYSYGPAMGAADLTTDAERVWALETIKTMVDDGAAYESTGTGEYFAIKPADYNVIYSLGCDPNCTDSSAKKRFLKVEYLFAPYKPGNAILTSGNLSFSSSVTVDVSLAASGGTANVHTNGDADGTGCSQTVNGTVTASGDYSVCGSVGMTGSGGDQPLESVPEVKARFLYNTFASQYATGWYDLCPDGEVKSPSTTPCDGTTLADLDSGGTYRGWSYADGSGTTPPVWSMTSTAWGDGIYYVYQGDAFISRNTVVNSATVIAESKPSGGPAATCGKLGGGITAKLVTISNAALPGTVLVADTDLVMTSNFEAGIGVFGAGDQIQVETSSNGITGTIIANDSCTDGGDINEVKNAVIKYDRNVEVPLLDIIRTTQWLELKAK